MARTLSDTAKRCQARGREGPDWCDASFARFQFRPVPAHERSAEAITLKANWINMYDKHGCVLGVETVINDPYEFKVRRRAGRRGRRTLGWHHLPKGVAFLPRYATVSAAANHRYLDALAIVDDPLPLTVPSTASCSQCEIATADRRVPSTPRPPPTSPPVRRCAPRGAHALRLPQPRRADAVVRASSGGRSPEQRAGLPPRQMPPPPQLVAKIPAPAAGASPSSATPF